MSNFKMNEMSIKPPAQPRYQPMKYEMRNLPPSDESLELKKNEM